MQQDQTVQWFPGHMARTRRQIRGRLERTVTLPGLFDIPRLQSAFLDFSLFYHSATLPLASLQMGLCQLCPSRAIFRT